MIDRYQIRYFLSVVEQGNFTRAAAHCNVSQPTLSVGIAKLEKTLETALFHRNNRRVSLTRAGTKFLEHAQKIENEFNLASSLIESAASPKTLRLAVLRSIAVPQLAASIAEMKQIDPAARLEILDGNEREVAVLLTRGRVDCALSIIDRGNDRFSEEFLFEEGYVMAMAEDHPLANSRSIRAEELMDEVMIVRRHCELLSQTSRHFTQRGVRPNFAYRSNCDDRVMRFVASGLGITLVPESLTHFGVAGVPLSGFKYRRKIGLKFSRDNDNAPYLSHPGVEGIRRATASGALSD